MTEHTLRKVLPVVGFIMAAVRYESGSMADRAWHHLGWVVATAAVMGWWLALGRHHGFTRKPWRFLLAGLVIWFSVNRENSASWWGIVELAGHAVMGAAVIAWLLAITVGRGSWRREVRFLSLALGIPLVVLGGLLLIAAMAGHFAGGTIYFFGATIQNPTRAQCATFGFGYVGVGLAMLYAGRWAIRSAVRAPRTPRSE